MGTATTVRLGHVAFRVRDLEASISWYAAAFGAKEAFRANRDDGTPQLVYIELVAGQFIEFFPAARTARRSPPNRSATAIPASSWTIWRPR